MAEAKFKVGDKVKVSNASGQFFWYSSVVGQEFEISGVFTYPEGRVEAFKYKVVGEPGRYILEKDLEPAVVALADLTLAQIKARLDELNATIASAKAELESVEAERKALLAELQGLGITFAGVTVQERKRSLRDLYLNDRELLTPGDEFIFMGDRSESRYHTHGQAYTISVVDDDGSVKITDDDGEHLWVWAHSGVNMEHFIQA